MLDDRERLEMSTTILKIPRSHQKANRLCDFFHFYYIMSERKVGESASSSRLIFIQLQEILFILFSGVYFWICLHINKCSFFVLFVYA